MPELRRDPVIGRWVIISTERGRKPLGVAAPEPRKQTGFCPFCEGNEDKTPQEVFAFRAPSTRPDSPGWTVRVVPNKFPALQIEGGLNRRADGMYDKMNGIGAHEVIIETPDHSKETSQLSVENVRRVLSAFRERILDLKKDGRFRHILVFKNHGEPAGASLEHSHSQLIATPIIPKRVAEELDGAKQHYDLKERCVFCDIMQQETADGKRIVIENDEFVAFAPFAARFPFETWILPRVHGAAFESIEEVHLTLLADTLKKTLMRINIALNNPSYNYILHSAPCKTPELEYYHWHIEIMPRLTRVAGFEWGTGFYINPTSPEDAAEFLGQISIEEPREAS
ncbi:MAG: galactose-1-phosphate uridylyltransferase [Latescibacteria bacterium DG_63]|nr:MAG: galactose-1-phosphate uridylyltransferase [Latescibacteria bacterium DG_63]